MNQDKYSPNTALGKKPFLNFLFSKTTCCQTNISKYIISSTTHLYVNAFTNVPFVTSFTNDQSILICRGGQ